MTDRQTTSTQEDIIMETLKAGFQVSGRDIAALRNVCKPDQRSQEEITNDVGYPRPKLVVDIAVHAILGYYHRIGHDLLFRCEDVKTEPPRGHWYVWCDNHWKSITNGDLKEDLLVILGSATPRQLREFLETMKIWARLNWDGFDTKDITPCQGKVFTIRDGVLRPHKHDKENYNTFVLPVSLPKRGNHEATRWQKILDDLLPNREDQQALQEMFGYCLFPYYNLQVFFVLHGPPRTGKSMVTRVLKLLIGNNRWSSKKLHKAAETFGLAELVDSWVNVDDEAEKIGRESEAIIKAITGGDRMSVERKYQDSTTMKINTRLIMTTNTMPRILDQSAGVWERIVYIPFQHVISSDTAIPEDLLIDDLGDEVPQIFLWSLGGIKRLLKCGRIRNEAFTQGRHVHSFLAHHREFSDTFLAWWVERVVCDQDKQCSRDILWRDYRRWAEISGVRQLGRPNWKHRIEERLREKYGPGWICEQRIRNQSRQFEDSDRERVRIYNGISLKDEEMTG